MMLLGLIACGLLVDLALNSKLTIDSTRLNRIFCILFAVVVPAVVFYGPIRSSYRLTHEIPLGPAYLESWGGFSDFRVRINSSGIPEITGSPTSTVGVDGARLAQFTDSFCLVAVLYHWTDPSVSDVAQRNISKSAAYTILPNRMELPIPVSPEFIRELIEGHRVSNYMLLAIPKKVKSEKFSTVEEAQRLGAQVIYRTTYTVPSFDSSN